MTALKEYERLEAPGLWRATPDAQRQEVIVSFGDATLVISDDRSGKVLAHWSLPAIIRRPNHGQSGALYAPSDEIGEELEIEDDTMIGAIDKVRAAIAAHRPHPGRLRMVVLGGAGVLALGLLVFWLPNALIDHAARVTPPAKRAEIGRAVLGELSTLTGAPCRSTAGDRALTALANRIGGGKQIVVLPETLRGARLLPGGIVTIGRPMIEGPDTPEVAAGYVIAASRAAADQDPLRDLLDWTGSYSAFKLLTTGDLPETALRGYGRVILETPPADPADDVLLADFATAGVSSTPYAFARDPSGETVLGLIEADPFKGVPAPEAVLDDAQWIALQEICSD